MEYNAEHNIKDQIFNLLTSYITDIKFGEHFKYIKEEDPYFNAKLQEDYLISNSYSIFNRLNNDYNDQKNFDSELDLKFGDFKDIYGNYYDLKVGLFSEDFKNKKQLCGSITIDSLKEFGKTSYDRHYYICVNYDFSRCYIINARLLYNEYNKDIYNNRRYKDFLGETDYKESEAIVRRIERK